MRAFLLTFVFLGCGSSNTNTTADAMADSPSMEASSDSGPTIAKYTGAILLSTNAVAMTYDVFGLFQPIAAPPSCSETKGSPCSFSDCPISMPGSSYFVAGMLDVSVGAMTIPVPKMANGEYRAKGTTTLFNGGEMVGAKWTGDPMGAPAMSLTALGVSHITVNNPVFPVIGVPISRSQPFTIDWSDGKYGKVHFSVWTQTMTRVQTVSCVDSATAGSLTVPSSLLSMLTGSTGYLSVDVLDANTMSQGEWQMTIEAHSMATDPNGRPLLLVAAVLN